MIAVRSPVSPCRRRTSWIFDIRLRLGLGVCLEILANAFPVEPSGDAENDLACCCMTICHVHWEIGCRRFLGCCDATWKLAEREGFEPSVGFPTHAFQASAFDHSATSPGARPLFARRPVRWAKGQTRFMPAVRSTENPGSLERCAASGHFRVIGAGCSGAVARRPSGF
jgi:hypothetical protein